MIDEGAGPLWLPSGPTTPEAMGLPAELAARIRAWENAANGTELDPTEDQLELDGERLAEEIGAALAGDYHVRYIP